MTLLDTLCYCQNFNLQNFVRHFKSFNFDFGSCLHFCMHNKTFNNTVAIKRIKKIALSR